MDFQLMNISDIEESDENWGNAILTFKINGFRFILSTTKDPKSGKFYTQIPLHKDVGICPICKLKSVGVGHCWRLNQNRSDLVVYLIEQPSIRLNWIFREIYQPK